MTVLGAYALSPAERARTLEAERSLQAFLAYRDSAGELRLAELDALPSASLGRLADNHVVVDWDPEVSRVHAQLERHGQVWTVVDDGLSRNGTFVNGERVNARRRLNDGDEVRIGRTALTFRAATDAIIETADAQDAGALAALTAAERRVLVALCRPLAVGGVGAVPPGNREVAEELHLSVDGVKARIKGLFAKLGVEDLPHHHKRAELARRALAAGLVTRRELMPHNESAVTAAPRR